MNNAKRAIFIANMIKTGAEKERLAEILSTISFEKQPRVSSDVLVDIPVERILSNIDSADKYYKVKALLSDGEAPDPVQAVEIDLDGEIFYILDDGRHRVEVFRSEGKRTISANIISRKLCQPERCELYEKRTNGQGVKLFLVQKLESLIHIPIQGDSYYLYRMFDVPVHEDSGFFKTVLGRLLQSAKRVVTA